MPPLAIRALIGSPLDGSTSDAIAAAPNAIEPSRLSATIRHDSERRFRHTQRWQTSAYASSLETRKQIDPTASGAHTRRLLSLVLRPCFIPVNVVTLKNTVPTSCTAAASQSIRAGSQDAGFHRRRPPWCPRSRSTLTVSEYCR